MSKSSKSSTLSKSSNWAAGAGFAFFAPSQPVPDPIEDEPLCIPSKLRLFAGDIGQLDMLPAGRKGRPKAVLGLTLP
jgi:hypothetical protein